MTKVEVRISGSRHGVKITPTALGMFILLANMLHRAPEPAKGSKNPLHWHIKEKNGNAKDQR